MDADALKKTLALNLPSYGRIEERLNIISHGIGALAAIAGLFFLLYQAYIQEAWRYWTSASIYGGGMIIMLSCSTFYHMAKKPVLRKWLRKCDHCVIFFFIAATYTPFTLLSLTGAQAIWWTVVVWSIAVVGMIIAFLPIKHKVWIELPLCLGLGWLAMCLYGAFSLELGSGAGWLLAGGVVYSVGAVLYLIKRMPFNHLVWHCCVLGGVSCHFVAISRYLMI